MLDAAEALLERNKSASIREGMRSISPAATGRPLPGHQRGFGSHAVSTPLPLDLDSGECIEVALFGVGEGVEVLLGGLDLG